MWKGDSGRQVELGRSQEPGTPWWECGLVLRAAGTEGVQMRGASPPVKPSGCCVEDGREGAQAGQWEMRGHAGGSRVRGSGAWKEVWQYGQRRYSDQSWRITECCLGEREEPGAASKALPSPPPQGHSRSNGMQRSGELGHRLSGGTSSEAKGRFVATRSPGLRLRHPPVLVRSCLPLPKRSVCPGFGTHLVQGMEM